MKRTLALLMVAIMAVFALAGCGGNQASNTPAPSQPASSQPGGSTSPDTNPLDGEKPVLKYLGYNVSFDPNTDLMAGIYEETTGYKVEYNVLPAENADEKLLMDVSSGADYDVMQVSVPSSRPCWLREL